MNSQVDILRALGLQQDLTGLLRRTEPQPPIRPPEFNLAGLDLNADKSRLATASAINPFFAAAAAGVPDPYAIEKQAKLYRNAAGKLYNRIRLGFLDSDIFHFPFLHDITLEWLAVRHKTLY